MESLFLHCFEVKFDLAVMIFFSLPKKHMIMSSEAVFCIDESISFFYLSLDTLSSRQ